MRVTMRAVIQTFLLMWAVSITSQAVAAEDVYIAELMVQSSVLLRSQTLLDTLTNITVQVEYAGAEYSVNLSRNELISECDIINEDTTCNCSDGYTWSNDVCYNYNCCRETPCTQNVSHITGHCVAKAPVRIYGSVIPSETTTWDSTKTAELTKEFERLNGFESLNVTGQRGNSVADFEAAVAVTVVTSKLQDIVTTLERKLQAELRVDTEGMVNIEAPDSKVCYQSSPVLNCTLEEKTDSSGWHMSREHERFELSPGSVVNLETDCNTDQYKSCVTLTLKEVTSSWGGMYECGFTSGSVRHTARSELEVASLPDEITLETSPLTVDCSKQQQPKSVEVTATIAKSQENFTVLCGYRNDCKLKSKFNTTSEDTQAYTFGTTISCTKTDETHNVTVTFKNSRGQQLSAALEIPVIYEGSDFCEEDTVDGDLWPSTPSGDTAINRTCGEGKTGYKSRTCKDKTWDQVFYNCINKDLKNVLDAADNFVKGLGATKEAAQNIFAGLKNSTVKSTVDSSETTAEVMASINVLETMAKASNDTVLHEDVLNDFIGAASNMLNSSWSGVNTSVVYNMSSDYLQSVETLVKNIQVNNSNGVESPNLKLRFCSNSDCNVSVFDVSVGLHKCTGMLKTMAVKNLMNKLRNNFDGFKHSSILLSATLVNSSKSSVDIKLDFPAEQQHLVKRRCVFWNTTVNEWSREGCKEISNGNRTLCRCNHLTAFSVLMAKGDISGPELDIITNVGLGVSVCSLLIFLMIEFLVWSAVVKTNLSHFRHTALINIAVFLLLGNCCFLASLSPETLSKMWCFSLTVGKHLFYLAMFSWMLCMSVMLVHQLIFVFNPLRKRVFTFLSSIVGYVCPVLIVGSSYVYCRYTDRPYYEPKTCWLVYTKLLDGSIHAFLLPVGTIILTNLFSMVVVIITLVRSSSPEGSKADDKETIKSIIKVVVFLTPVFGVTWIIGFAQLMLDEEDPMYQVATYSFTILNSFQGLFLLLMGCFAEPKVREELFRLITAKSKGKSESMKNLTSTTQTKDQ